MSHRRLDIYKTVLITGIPLCHVKSTPPNAQKMIDAQKTIDYDLGMLPSCPHDSARALFLAVKFTAVAETVVLLAVDDTLAFLPRTRTGIPRAGSIVLKIRRLFMRDSVVGKDKRRLATGFQFIIRRQLKRVNKVPVRSSFKRQLFVSGRRERSLHVFGRRRKVV